MVVIVKLCTVLLYLLYIASYRFVNDSRDFKSGQKVEFPVVTYLENLYFHYLLPVEDRAKYSNMQGISFILYWWKDGENMKFPKYGTIGNYTFYPVSR